MRDNPPPSSSAPPWYSRSVTTPAAATPAAKGAAAEPAIYPSSREEYKELHARGLQFFGRFRNSEYDLLREAATQALSIYL